MSKTDNELFELCKEVYKRFPEWGLHIVNSEIASYREDLRFYKYSGLSADEPTIGNEPVYNIIYIHPVPLYTSDYILDKLPRNIGKYELEMSCGHDWFNFGYRGWRDGGVLYPNFGEGESETPLKALLKLVIALSDAGELS